MNIKFSWKEIVFTVIFVGLIMGFAFWQGQKEIEKKQQELQKSTQQPKQKADEVVDALEKIVKQPTEQWKTVKMRVTAYCPCKKCCETWANIPVSSGKRKNASGHTIHVGDKFVAAPRNYPFGTEMVIEGYAGGKVVKVEDVGGAIKDNKLDLYFDTHDDALKFGRKDVNVRVKIRG